VKKLKDLPPRCRAGDNANAFLGGFRLWEKKTPHPNANEKLCLKKGAMTMKRTILKALTLTALVCTPGTTASFAQQVPLPKTASEVTAPGTQDLDRLRR
jgi:hypothetical protein